MEEIQFGNQENQINFVPENPKTNVSEPAIEQPQPEVIVTQLPPNQRSKILPWALGIGLALIGGAIFYKVSLNQDKVLGDGQVRTLAETSRPSALLVDDLSGANQNDLTADNGQPQNKRATAENLGVNNTGAATIAGDVVLQEKTPSKTVTLQATPTASPSVVAGDQKIVDLVNNGQTVTKGGLVKQVSAQTVTSVPARTTAQVTGTVTVNGSIPSNSSILVLYRLPGAAEFTAASRISASNGSTWTLHLPTHTNYEVKLAWQVNENNYLLSDTVTVTAPAKVNTTFNINISSNGSSNNSNSKPWTPGIDSCGNLSDNHWNARLALHKYTDNIVSYHVQVGTSDGNNDVYDHVFDQFERVIFPQSLENDKTYYLRYQVKIGNKDSNWTDWSNTAQIKCKKS